ncbi:hypothetical protein HZH68_008332 [Vespula germanica]|uniref:Uncharacterized protein n=1 Tax=Vespula germanica TaxID=30212 RepID=A0A834N8J5_VESGE|nr:hypothetical protein HZH68_008332 [Vespula germanica]
MADDKKGVTTERRWTERDRSSSPTLDLRDFRERHQGSRRASGKSNNSRSNSSSSNSTDRISGEALAAPVAALAAPATLTELRKITKYDLEIGLFGKSEDIRDVYRQTQADGRRTLAEGKLFDETRDRNGKCLVASILGKCIED